MNSLSRKELEHIVQEAADAISAATLRALCDQQVEEALATFSYDYLEVPVVQDSFLALLGKFMLHLVEHGVVSCRRKDAAGAAEEAVFILEHAYEGDGGCGYEGALRDVSQYGSEKIPAVLSTLADSLRNTVKRNHARWAMTRYVGSLTWEARVSLAALPEWERLLGKMISGRSPAELAPACEELIMAKAASDERLGQILAS